MLLGGLCRVPGGLVLLNHHVMKRPQIMRLTIKAIFQVLFLLLVQELEIFEAVFIVRLDLLSLNHMS
jgi:hypothetical protein